MWNVSSFCPYLTSCRTSNFGVLLSVQCNQVCSYIFSVRMKSIKRPLLSANRQKDWAEAALAWRPSIPERPLQRTEPHGEACWDKELGNVIAWKVWNILKSIIQKQLGICIQERERHRAQRRLQATKKSQRMVGEEQRLKEWKKTSQRHNLQHELKEYG